MAQDKQNSSKKEYNHSEIEAKWQEVWESDKLYSPNIINAKKPFFNLMMFLYPSAEGLHVGNMYAFTGADVYGRYQRMKGNDVFEPIGLDGFGIHSENYAMKVGRHPKVQAEIAESNFYRQLKSIGNSFDWNRTIETYDPEYYKWTQWLFTQLFKNGLAYRKKATVNWCPQDQTVLSDEQVIAGECERCGSKVEKKELEQWFFRITNYAERLLNNIESLNWTEKVKIAQRNWIGKSEGAEVEFEVDEKSNYVLLHGYTGSVEANFFPWLKKELEKRGNKVWAQNLPNTDNPNIDEQAEFVLKNAQIDENTVILGHSLGSVVALKVLEKLEKPIKNLVLGAGFMQPGFLDHDKSFEEQIGQFDTQTIKKNVANIVLLRAKNDTAVPKERADYIKEQIGGEIIDFESKDDHICGEIEPKVLEVLLNSLKVFTTRPDTLYGATFMVIAPEHPLAEQVANNNNGQEVKEYIEMAKSKTDIERTAEGKEKTGVDTGLFAINPLNQKKIRIFVADYVLSGYGTGAIMAVPAHDQRDFEFAKKYDLPIVQVIQDKESRIKNGELSEAFEGKGEIIGSDEWNGFHMPEDADKILSSLEAKKIGKRKIQYHLRDWLISRQRYWGPPIPMIYCENCATNNKGERNDMPGWYCVSDDKLPVLLPDVEDWKPMGTGKAPLDNHPEFFEVDCPKCGKPAKRETDVSDTFLDSAWYFLRYPSIDIQTAPFDTEITKKWLPVNMYIGGAEHSVLHLLYARFITMALHDLKYLNFEEPFSRFFANGLVIKDGAKMSKSKGNVVVPDAYISKYGADTLRSYLMFIAPLSEGGDFRDSGIEGMNRFLKKVWKLISEKPETNEASIEAKRFMHRTIQKVTKQVEEFTNNTALASLMEWYNFLSTQEGLMREEKETYLKLLAPFAPHMTEELWQKLGNTNSIHISSWPDFDSAMLQSETADIVVQVNGKKRLIIEVKSLEAKDKEKIEKMAREQLSKYLEGQDVVKVIYVEGKILNIVVK